MKTLQQIVESNATKILDFGFMGVHSKEFNMQIKQISNAKLQVALDAYRSGKLSNRQYHDDVLKALEKELELRKSKPETKSIRIAKA